MARELKLKPDKKSKSSTSKAQTKAKSNAISSGNHVPKNSTARTLSNENFAPASKILTSKSILDQSLSSSTSSVDLDFPRGAPTPAKGVKRERQPLASFTEDKDLFDDGMQSFNATAKSGSKRNEVDSSSTAAKKRKIGSSSSSSIKTKKADISTTVKPASGKNTSETFRVEHLSYKRLLPGPTVVLVQIVQILPLEIIVSLPNQLMGHIPITNISKVFTSRLEEEDEASESESEDEEGSEDALNDDKEGEETDSGRLPNLTEMFSVGQYLRAGVVNVLPPRAASAVSQANYGRHRNKQRGNEEWKSSRRAELSLESEKANAGISITDLKLGQIVLQGQVKSIEDNGYILDFGLENGLTAFIGFKEEKKVRKADQENWPRQSMTLGGIVQARVLKISENGRTCDVLIARSEREQTMLSSAPNISSLLPGTLVSGQISALTLSGLNISFLSYFSGTVDSFHMLPATSHTYKVGEKVKARILWTTPPLNDSTVHFALSLLPHIIKFSSKMIPSTPGSFETAPISQVLPVGTFLEQLQVVKIEAEWGLLCVVPGTTISVFVHISHVSDEHLTTLGAHTTTSGPYKVGTVHRGRVIGYSAIDGLLQASTQQSVIDRKFMKVTDLKVGDVLEGTVQRLSDTALFVNIQGNVAGIVWPLHYSDLKLRHPERKFKPGGKVKSRVLALDSEKNRVVLTLKRLLINSNSPVLQNFNEAKVGMILQAIVHTFLDKGMFVELFGGMKAFVGIGEIAADKFVEDVKKEFTIGQVVEVRLTSIDKATSRFTASIKQAQEGYEAPSKNKGKSKEAMLVQDIGSVELGDPVSGEVADIHEAQIVLVLEKVRLKALLSLASLARYCSTTITDLKATLPIGAKIPNLSVVSKNAEKGLVIVVCALSQNQNLLPLVQASNNVVRNGISSSTEALFTFDMLSVGQIIEGVIGDQISTGYFVQLTKGIRGKVRWSDLGDDYDAVQGLDLKKGVRAKCIVTEYDLDSKRIELSLRASKMDSSTVFEDIRDISIDNIAELDNGQKVRGFVKGISDAGLFVDLGKNATARVQIKDLFDDYIKEWKTRFVIGQLVDGKILTTSLDKGQVEMTLRKSDKVKRAKNDIEPSVAFEGLRKGQIINGTIKRVETYGAFIRILGSNVSGLCHKSEVSDESKTDWESLVSLDKELRAVIISLDVEKRKIGFSMKASRLSEGTDDNEEASADDSVLERLDRLHENEESASDDGSDESGDDLEIVMDEVNGSSQELKILQDAQMEAPRASIPPAPLKLSAFKWDGQVDIDTNSDIKAGPESEEDLNASDNEAEPAVRNTAKGILIDDQTGELAGQLPTRPSDFDRLLLGSPSSSYLWIQYMSYYLQISDIEQARQTGQRALKTVNYREEEEKLNVWIAMINLENTKGTDESLEEVFSKALLSNDDKQVYIRTLEILEQTEKYQKAQEYFERFVKKFKTSSKAWSHYGQFLLNRSQASEARNLLPRSLKSLPQRKHVKTISKFAQMEFKSGEPERGRTIFEGIVDSYPKRLDLWWIYIDQETRLRNTAGVRALFDRVLAQKQSSKKTKSLLKKWLAFEKQYGDEAGAETVKERAVSYVQQMQQ